MACFRYIIVNTLHTGDNRDDDDDDDDDGGDDDDYHNDEPKWLKVGEMFLETMIDIQYKVLSTNNDKKYILKEPNITKHTCRICREKSETIQHIRDARRALTQGDYTHTKSQPNIQHTASRTGYYCSLSKGKPTPHCKYEP